MYERPLITNPIFATIFVSNQCNLRCRHCIFDSGTNYENELSDTEIYSLIKKLHRLGIQCLDLSGGETLLHPHIFDFINFAYAIGIPFVSMATNGILMNKAIVKKIKNIRDEGHKLNLRISLDGDEKTHDWLRGSGNFKRTIHALELLCQNNIRPREINFVLHKKNFDKIEQVIQLIIPFRPFSLVIMPLILEGRAQKFLTDCQITPQMWKETLERQKVLQRLYPNIEINIEGPTQCILEKDLNLNIPKACMCGYQFVGITSIGDILICPVSLLSIGNIRTEQNLGKLWLSSKILEKVRDVRYLKGKCRNCRLKIVCRGGCRGIAEALNGDITTPDPLCWL